MHCAFYNTLADMRGYVHAHLKGHHVSVFTAPLSLKTLHPDTDVLAVFVDSPVTKEIMKKLPRLRLIAAMSTGYDHIDLTEAKKRKMTVCNVPFYGENTVAEHAMALLLALSRRLFESVKRVKEGVFDYHELRGFDLKGKTVGVIGTGRIGMYCIGMLKGFGVRVVAHDTIKNRDATKKLGFTYLPLQKLLAVSDIISLHLPLLPNTYHIINTKNIKKIKKGAYIINTARGGLIDPEALVWGLESGHIAGAALDVLEKEEFIQHPDALFDRKKRKQSAKKSSDDRVTLLNNILIDHPRVIITPHNAFNSTEAIERIFSATIDNIKAFAAGHPTNVVRPPLP